jgi:hypothetical protein
MLRTIAHSGPKPLSLDDGVGAIAAALGGQQLAPVRGAVLCVVCRVRVRVFTPDFIRSHRAARYYATCRRRHCRRRRVRQ